MRIFVPVILLLLIVWNSKAESFLQDDWHTKTYTVNDFSRLSIEGGYKVILQQGQKCQLVVKANDSDVFEYLKVRNRGDELRIDKDPDGWHFDRVVLYLTVVNLESIDIEGGIKLDTKGYIEVSDLRLHVEGGANIDMEIKADNLDVRGEGGVFFQLEGVTNSLKVHISGAGHLDADQMKSKDADVWVEGVGSGSVYATETLKAKIEGVGRITYQGNPVVTKSIEGLGSVVHHEE